MLLLLVLLSDFSELMLVFLVVFVSVSGFLVFLFILLKIILPNLCLPWLCVCLRGAVLMFFVFLEESEQLLLVFLVVFVVVLDYLVFSTDTYENNFAKPLFAVVVCLSL